MGELIKWYHDRYLRPLIPLQREHQGAVQAADEEHVDHGILNVSLVENGIERLIGERHEEEMCGDQR